MELILHRKHLKDKYTIGELHIDNKKVCDTLEDTVRTLNNASDKVYGETAIPYGKYEVAMNVISPKFGTKPFYQEVCQGRLPRLVNVPFFDGVLIHVADGEQGAKLLEGCIGVGENRLVGGLVNGKETFRKLYKILSNAHNIGEKIYISIK